MNEKIRPQLMKDIAEGREPKTRLGRVQVERIAAVKRPQLQVDIAEAMSSAGDIHWEDERR